MNIKGWQVAGKGRWSMERMNICVLFGGKSSEHAVSCMSAASVISNLDPVRYEVTKVGITKEGRWMLYTGTVDKIRTGEWEQEHNKACVLSPDAGHRGLLVLNKNGDYTILHVDVLFPVLHGKNGEDGTIQGLFELSGIPYVGDGVLASAVSMDKTYTKLVMEQAGIAQADYLICRNCSVKELDDIHQKIERSFGYPCFVKPANAGSSVGISKAKDKESLRAALDNALLHDRHIVIEEAVIGRELECSVLGTYTEVSASGVGEIVPAAEFYDYNAKYHDANSALHIPANLDEETVEKIRKIAVQAFQAVDGFGLARVDFFLREDGEVLLNELNTLPGFTSISMYAKLWEAKGLSYSDLLTSLIELAEKR